VDCFSVYRLVDSPCDHGRETVVQTGAAPNLGREADSLSRLLVLLLVLALALFISLQQELINRRHVTLQRPEIVLLVLSTEIRQDSEDVLVSQALDVISRGPETMEPELLFQFRKSLEGILACG